MSDQPNTECLYCHGYVPAGLEFCSEDCDFWFGVEVNYNIEENEDGKETPVHTQQPNKGGTPAVILTVKGTGFPVKG